MFNTNLDVMLEVKDKEVSVLKMYHKYYNIRVDEKGQKHYSIKKYLLTKH